MAYVIVRYLYDTLHNQSMVEAMRLSITDNILRLLVFSLMSHLAHFMQLHVLRYGPPRGEPGGRSTRSRTYRQLPTKQVPRVYITIDRCLRHPS